MKIVEKFIRGKDGALPCGDNIFVSENYVAVIDGATPKGTRKWNGTRGDVFVSEIIKSALALLPSDLCATEAISRINEAVNSEYEKHETSFFALLPEERLQASVVIYSAHHREIWLFGDCIFSVNGCEYIEKRRLDTLLSDLRALVIENARREGIAYEGDIGREAILPLLKKCISYANQDGEFGYDAINGGEIKAENVKIVKVNSGDFVILASDGYPRLLDTLEKTESYLFEALKSDPECIGILRSTKGLSKENESFDDRSYVSFFVS